MEKNSKTLAAEILIKRKEQFKKLLSVNLDGDYTNEKFFDHVYEKILIHGRYLYIKSAFGMKKFTEEHFPEGMAEYFNNRGFFCFFSDEGFEIAPLLSN